MDLLLQPSYSEVDTPQPAISPRRRTGVKPWTADEWSMVLWWATIARNPIPLPVQSLTARGAAVHAARRLRELALQTEILSSLAGGLR